MKDIDEERHGSKTKRQKKDGNRTGSREPGKKPEWKKDGLTKILEGWNYGSKNRNQSHWLKAAYPREYLASVQRQQLEPRLPGLPVSTCLPLPPILFLLLIVHHSSSFYSFFPSPFILCFVLFFASIFLIPPFSLHTSQLSSKGGPPSHCYHLYPWSVAHRYAESFHANSPGTPSSSAYTRTRSPVKTVTHRWTGRSQHIARVSSSLILRLGERTQRPLRPRSTSILST